MATDVELNEALRDAIRSNNLITVNKLIYKKVDVNKDDAGTTPLMLAAMYGRKKIAEALIKAGADVNAKDGFGATVLMHASGYNRVLFQNSKYRPDRELVKLLLAHGADVNAKNSFKKMTALMFAIQDERLDIVNQFIIHDADLNAQDYHGHTALWHAINEKISSKFVKVLLTAGADTKIKDKDGKTVLDKAISCERPDIVKLIQKAQARQKIEPGLGHLVQSVVKRLTGRER